MKDKLAAGNPMKEWWNSLSNWQYEFEAEWFNNHIYWYKKGMGFCQNSPIHTNMEMCPATALSAISVAYVKLCSLWNIRWGLCLYAKVEDSNKRTNRVIICIITNILTWRLKDVMRMSIVIHQSMFQDNLKIYFLDICRTPKVMFN